MPVLKLTEKDKRKMIAAKKACPCLKQATLAMLFDCSPARVGEILREADGRKRKS